MLRVHGTGTGEQLAQQDFCYVAIFWLLVHLVLLPVEYVFLKHRRVQRLRQGIAQIFDSHSVWTRPRAYVAKRHWLWTDVFYYVDNFLCVDFPE